jgi:hypothetical protein
MDNRLRPEIDFQNETLKRVAEIWTFSENKTSDNAFCFAVIGAIGLATEAKWWSHGLDTPQGIISRNVKRIPGIMQDLGVMLRPADASFIRSIETPRQLVVELPERINVRNYPSLKEVIAKLDKQTESILYERAKWLSESEKEEEDLA